jgi:hypothetical protein
VSEVRAVALEESKAWQELAEKLKSSEVGLWAAKKEMDRLEACQFGERDESSVFSHPTMRHCCRYPFQVLDRSRKIIVSTQTIT